MDSQEEEGHSVRVARRIGVNRKGRVMCVSRLQPQTDGVAASLRGSGKSSSCVYLIIRTRRHSSRPRLNPRTILTVRGSSKRPCLEKKKKRQARRSKRRRDVGWRTGMEENTIFSLG